MTIWSPSLETQAGPRYLAIVRALSDDIDRGRLRPGDRLPTHRDLGDRLGVAVGTITRAYAEAERLGLVRGEIGRGTFVTSVGRPSYALKKGASAARLIELGMNEPLSAADPDIATSLRALAKRNDLQDLLRYQPPEGMPRHRGIGARWLARCGVDVAPDQVVLCSGAQHALVASLSAVASSGDWVFTEEMTYPGIKAAAKLLHLRLHGIAMDDEGLTPEAFESACKQRSAKALYCVPTLQNPTVTTMSSKRRKAIVKIAKQYDIAIVEDDVMRPLVEDAPPTLASLAPDRTFFITTLSKAISGGLRVAFVACPQGTAPNVGEGVWATQYMVPPLMAEIAATWIEDNTAERAMQWKREAIKERLDVAGEVLSGLTFHSHPSSYHIWVELPEGWTSASFSAEARRRGVVVTPAEAFQISGGEPPRCVRVCLGAVDDVHTLRAGLEVLAEISTSSPDPARAIV